MHSFRVYIYIALDVVSTEIQPQAALPKTFAKRLLVPKRRFREQKKKMGKKNVSIRDCLKAAPQNIVHEFEANRGISKTVHRTHSCICTDTYTAHSYVCVMFCNLRHTGAQGVGGIGRESRLPGCCNRKPTKSATDAGTSAVFTFGPTCTNDGGTEGRA